MKDNKNLYKKVELGYDPYKEKNIDSRRNSYLRLFYNDNFDLSALRKNIETYNLNHELNGGLIKTINKKIKFIITFYYLIYYHLILIKI